MSQSDTQKVMHYLNEAHAMEHALARPAVADRDGAARVVSHLPGGAPV